MSSPALCHGCCKEHPLPAMNIQGMWFCEDCYNRLVKNNTMPCVECGEDSLMFGTRCLPCKATLLSERISKVLKERESEVGFGE